MKKNTKNLIGIHNTYTIVKRNIITNESAQVAKFTNMVLDNFYELFLNNKQSKIINIYAAVFGTGTAEPQATDTDLTQRTWGSLSSGFTNLSEISDITIHDENSVSVRFKFIIPATTEFVGSVTEMGITGRQYNSMYLITKALIKDAEGNPIAIEKTDIEELTVLLDWQFVSSNNPEGFIWDLSSYKAQKYWQAEQRLKYIPCFGTGPITGGGSSYYPRAQMCLTRPGKISKAATIGNSINVISSYSNKCLTVDSCRFTADNCPDSRYIHALALYGINNSIIGGYWKFPNSNLFPNKTFTSMSVGTGDGVTKEFKPPLNLWVKDTEKIYIDGVLLTRGVDYTCDHKNNLDNLPELYPSNFGEPFNAEYILHRYGYIEIMRDNRHIQTSMKFTDNGGLYTGYVTELFDKDHPYIIKLEEDPSIGLNVDTFVLQGLTNYDNSTQGNDNNMRNVTFILSYSNDNIQYTEVCRYTCPDQNLSAQTFTFEEVSAKYWKLEVDTSRCQENKQNRAFINYEQKTCYLKHSGKPIIFTNPPAEGAIITMDADIDRPLKNSNFIIDINPVFQF